MASNSNSGQPLAGLDADLASRPVDGSATGGVDESVGTSQGELLDQQDDRETFKYIDSLVRRQEILKRNQLAQDTYWTYVKLGRGSYYKLRYDSDDYSWKCEPVRGANLFGAESIPNKAWDLCNKTVETLMQDPPQPAPQTLDDSEEAERGAEMAEEFLTQDGGEKGTRDNLLFWASLDAATSKSSAYHHYWVDKTGGGYVPLQIKAHPLAQSPAQPMIGPDGVPTTDPVLRYVTDSDTSAAQFTDDPSQAPPQWLPCIRVDRGGREHIRVFPETADVSDAEKIVWVFYSTLGEGKRRWKDTVGALDDAGLTALSDWAPPRPLPLLPPHLRSRYKLRSGDTKQAVNDGDERLFFYYALYIRPSPDYPRGAMLYVNGMSEGTVLEKGPWAAEVPTPDGKGTDVRCLDLPFVQIGLVVDAEDKDPSDKPLLERFGAASMAQQRLASDFEQLLDRILNPARFVNATSPVTAEDVEESRATGKILNVYALSSDWVKYEDPPAEPGAFFPMIEWHDDRMNSIAGLNKPAQGDDKQQEVSGTARRIAVDQANIALGRFQQRLNSSWERHWRVKLQLVQKEFSAPTLLRYVGEDGASKQEWFSGVDFAQIGEVGIQPGTGTLLPPQQKVNYLSSLVQMQFMAPDEAQDAARPAFSRALGIADDPAKQRVERQVGTWLKGPPQSVPGPVDPTTGQPTQIPWVQAYQMYQQQQQQYAALQQSAQEAVVQHTQTSNAAAVHAHPSAPPSPPQLPPPPTPPWSPFAPLPCDDEPLIAAMRARRLSKLMNRARFSGQPPEWQQVVFAEYSRMRNAVAMSQQPQLPRGVTVAMKGDASTVGAEEKAAMNPNAPPQPAQAAPQQAA